MWAPAHDERPSSTRAEICGLIASLFAMRPVHVGIDNAACVSRARRILRDGSFAAVWGLSRDGDLWEQVAELIAQRGPESVRVSKVLGHADSDDVARGRTTKRHMDYNHLADSLA
eukprot:2806526-Alexandrium_andersonii.AAC.1